MTFLSYAQNHEDVLLWRVLKEVEQGFWIDVGAWDPDAHSVTKAFYDRSWSGINIEPQPTAFRALSAARPRDINLQLALGAHDGDVLLFDFRDTGLSTLSADIAQKHKDRGFVAEEIWVAQRTLRSICKEYVKQRPVHFLKIDVEGSERDVLIGADFKNFRPWVIVIESTLPLTNVNSSDSFASLLKKSKYKFALFDGLNGYFVAEEKLELIEALSIPVNVLDNYARLDSIQQDFVGTANPLGISQRLLNHQAQQQLAHEFGKNIQELKDAFVAQRKLIDEQNKVITNQSEALSQLNQASANQSEVIATSHGMLDEVRRLLNEQIESRHVSQSDVTNQSHALANVAQASANQSNALAQLNQASANQSEALAQVARASSNQSEAMAAAQVALGDMRKILGVQAALIHGHNAEITNQSDALAKMAQASANQSEALLGLSRTSVNQSEAIAATRGAVTQIYEFLSEQTRSIHAHSAEITKQSDALARIARSNANQSEALAGLGQTSANQSEAIVATRDALGEVGRVLSEQVTLMRESDAKITIQSRAIDHFDQRLSLAVDQFQQEMRSIRIGNKRSLDSLSEFFQVANQELRMELGEMISAVRRGLSEELRVELGEMISAVRRGLSEELRSELETLLHATRSDILGKSNHLFDHMSEIYTLLNKSIERNFVQRRAEMEQAVEAAVERAQFLEHKVAAIESSRSWRMTAPLRAVRLLPALFRDRLSAGEFRRLIFSLKSMPEPQLKHEIPQRSGIVGIGRDTTLPERPEEVEKQIFLRDLQVALSDPRSRNPDEKNTA